MRPHIDWRELHDLGFSVIPVRVGEKIPAVQWARYQNQRANLAEIEAWQSARYNAGIVTGAISGIVVLDCDTRESIAEARALGIPEGTVSVGTAKGCHFYFLHPGFPVRNKAGVFPGMDVRGDGGFVVAPGSIHPAGVTYEWLNHPAWHEIAPLPAWLLEMLHDDPNMETARYAATGNGETAYGQRALERELTIFRNAPIGSRNCQLNRSAYVLAQLAAGGHVDAEETQVALRKAASAVGLESDETHRTLESGWQAGLKAPRGPRQEGVKSKNSPTIFSASELSEMIFAPVHWAIPGILPEGLALLAGRPKFGKSFLALQIAVAVASGEGKTFGLPEIEAGDVLYCALEDGPRRLKDRVDRMYPFGGAPTRLQFATGWPPLDRGGVKELELWCDRHPAARVVIFDTWRTIKPASTGRGSAYDEDASAAAPLLEFAKRRPGLAILVIHHVRKMDADDVFDTISGTHGLTGIFDNLLVLARHGEGAKLAAQGRDLESYEKALERDKRTGGWIVKGDVIALAKTGERQELLDLLSDARDSLSLSELARSVGKKRDATCHLLKSLIAEGKISQPRHGQYALAASQHPQSAQHAEDEPS